VEPREEFPLVPKKKSVAQKIKDKDWELNELISGQPHCPTPKKFRKYY